MTLTNASEGGVGSIITKYRHSWRYYFWATAIPWAFWFAAAAISRVEQPTHELVVAESVLGVLGLLGPMVIALVLIGSDRTLLRDFYGRVLNFRASRPVYWIVACTLMPLSILTAMAISLKFGYSASQFQLAARASFTSGIFPVWFLLLLAPTLEELGWHTYGTDCLRSRFNLFTTSIIFAVYWAFWHAPLALIKGYYQSNLVHQGLWDALNFPVSIIPFVLIMNWLYYRTARNILVAIIFHITSGYFNELFATHPDSKIIQTGLLLAFAVVVLCLDWRLFFRREPEQAGDKIGVPSIEFLPRRTKM